ncbi:ParB/RepB/Spo0J family partition protein [Streptomyces sp. NBC_00878]|uniref:ParB/RepB/Spo0J family partition protein n=1 Tax=Streptomyces sp. NBC_00878 TaxID=2975854 RepID=UPI00224CF35C|nr:ParB/RepB/Spo0J family partition protein [Streptomyces sp. NBC_00878]MCX4911892.1 ParB/RepB/Spo0J family partition protein [Streptomyces sp. NBC_00878]
MMAARNDFDDFFGDDEDVPVTDTRADGRLYRVPLTRLSPNLVNPRTDFGTEDALIDFGKSLQRRQNQACPVVSRNAYLKLWPDHRDQVKDVDYILVSGERRYRAANAVGLPVLDCVVNDDFAADRKTFMEAVVSENVDRQNFDPVEEAYAVQALVREFGSNRAVAQHFERVDGWVTQRVLLTHLARDVQDLVRAKTMPLEAARQLGKLTKDKHWAARDQLVWWGEEQERRAAASAARSAARKVARQAPPEPASAPALEPARATPPAAAETRPGSLMGEPSFTAVKLQQTSQPEREERLPGAAAPPVQEAPVEREPDRTPSPVPEPRPGAATEAVVSPPRLPYHDGTFIAQHLAVKMGDEPYFLMLRVLLEKAQEKDPAAMAQVLEQIMADVN